MRPFDRSELDYDPFNLPEHDPFSYADEQEEASHAIPFFHPVHNPYRGDPKVPSSLWPDPPRPLELVTWAMIRAANAFRFSFDNLTGAGTVKQQKARHLSRREAREFLRVSDTAFRLLGEVRLVRDIAPRESMEEHYSLFSLIRLLRDDGRRDRANVLFHRYSPNDYLRPLRDRPDLHHHLGAGEKRRLERERRRAQRQIASQATPNPAPNPVATIASQFRGLLKRKRD